MEELRPCTAEMLQGFFKRVRSNIMITFPHKKSLAQTARQHKMAAKVAFPALSVLLLRVYVGQSQTLA
jgi:hypothetical protein